MRKVLFVCTGNTCRSPMAEGIARRVLSASGSMEFRSAGTTALPGAPASPLAAAVAWSHGVNLGHHRATTLSVEVARWADLIVCMTAGHAAAVRRLPVGRPIILLTEWLGTGDKRHGSSVPDPYGGSAADYEAAFGVLHEAIMRFAKPDQDERNHDG